MASHRTGAPARPGNIRTRATTRAHTSTRTSATMKILMLSQKPLTKSSRCLPGYCQLNRTSRTPAVVGPEEPEEEGQDEGGERRTRRRTTPPGGRRRPRSRASVRLPSRASAPARRAARRPARPAIGTTSAAAATTISAMRAATSCAARQVERAVEEPDRPPQQRGDGGADDEPHRCLRDRRPERPTAVRAGPGTAVVSIRVPEVIDGSPRPAHHVTAITGMSAGALPRFVRRRTGRAGPRPPSPPGSASKTARLGEPFGMMAPYWSGPLGCSNCDDHLELAVGCGGLAEVDGGVDEHGVDLAGVERGVGVGERTGRRLGSLSGFTRSSSRSMAGGAGLHAPLESSWPRRAS